MDVFGDEDLTRLHGEWSNIDESSDDESMSITVTVIIAITSTGSVKIIVLSTPDTSRS